MQEPTYWCALPLQICDMICLKFVVLLGHFGLKKLMGLCVCVYVCVCVRACVCVCARTHVCVCVCFVVFCFYA